MAEEETHHRAGAGMQEWGLTRGPTAALAGQALADDVLWTQEPEALQKGD